MDDSGAAQNMDRYYQRAFELITSPRVQTAFDLSREPLPLQERYGRHAWGQAALLARRLVEAGVTFVTINHFEAEIDWWDDHYNIEANLRRRLPIYDQALGTLIEDLHQRGLADDVLVAAFGEFGRGPVINDRDSGRGHWARAWHALLSGGGVKGGRTIGAPPPPTAASPPTDLSDPATSTLPFITRLGIDPATTINDRQNRPIRLVDRGEPIGELFFDWRVTVTFNTNLEKVSGPFSIEKGPDTFSDRFSGPVSTFVAGPTNRCNPRGPGGSSRNCRAR